MSLAFLRLPLPRYAARLAGRWQGTGIYAFEAVCAHVRFQPASAGQETAVGAPHGVGASLGALAMAVIDACCCCSRVRVGRWGLLASIWPLFDRYLTSSKPQVGILEAWRNCGYSDDMIVGGRYPPLRLSTGVVVQAQHWGLLSLSMGVVVTITGGLSQGVAVQAGFRTCPLNPGKGVGQSGRRHLCIDRGLASSCAAFFCAKGKSRAAVNR